MNAPTKIASADATLDVNRRAFLVGSAASGLMLGYALPGIVGTQALAAGTGVGVHQWPLAR